MLWDTECPKPPSTSSEERRSISFSARRSQTLPTADEMPPTLVATLTTVWRLQLRSALSRLLLFGNVLFRRPAEFEEHVEIPGFSTPSTSAELTKQKRDWKRCLDVGCQGANAIRSPTDAECLCIDVLLAVWRRYSCQLASAPVAHLRPCMPDSLPSHPSAAHADAPLPCTRRGGQTRWPLRGATDDSGKHLPSSPPSDLPFPLTNSHPICTHRLMARTDGRARSPLRACGALSRLLSLMHRPSRSACSERSCPHLETDTDTDTGTESDSPWMSPRTRTCATWVPPTPASSG